MKLVLAIVTLANIISCSCNVAMTYTNFLVATHIESLSADIRDSWQKNNSAYERLGVALGQIERDIIRIRAKAQNK
jgi:predicted small integral membrane protein